jgi:hypothetical protein
MGRQYFISDKCESYMHICELNYNISVEDNFWEDETSGGITILIMIAYIIIIYILSHCFFKLDEKTIPDSKNKAYYILGFISSSYIIIVILIKYFNMDELEVCSYPRFCNEGLDDEIVETNYYYLKDECPREYPWITSEYDDGYSLSICDDTEYGCCSISTEEISCSERSGFTLSDVNTYSEYLKYKDEYVGKWPLRLSKIDEEGTNCPSIEELIYDYSAKKEDNYSLTLLVVSFISNFIVMIILFLYRCCSTKEYVKTRSFELGDIENKGSELDNNIVRGSA